MSTLPSVPKPNPAGQPQTAIAVTSLAYANLREGPGLQYRDIGDINKYTLITHYPSTQTNDGWVWVEQYGRSGWVSTSVIRFEAIDTSVGSGLPPTPYDGKSAIWHWRGDSISENTIAEVAENIRRFAPTVTQLWVKTSDWTQSSGAQWQGFWDSDRELAIDGPASIDKWVRILAQYGIEFHAWCVPRGSDIVAETNLIIQACLRPGVRSMILDVEPYEGFWIGGRDAVRPYMLRIRGALPGSFHIGMAIDPRTQHYDSIYPLEWFPFVNSVHPMVYWDTFKRTPEDTLRETYQVWGGYGKPIIPILQGDAEANEIRSAQTLATQRHGAKGVSWWRLGVIGPVEYAAINQPVTGDPPPQPPGTRYGEEKLISPQDNGFSIFSHTGQQELTAFQGTWGWNVYYKQTEARASKTTVRWAPRLGKAGTYEISVFVSTRNATTTNARYKIHGIQDVSGETIVTVNQSRHRNRWVTLGVFDLVGTSAGGVIFLNDLTGESDKKIAFDAVRWREVITVDNPDGIPLADGYDSPVGTDAERRTLAMWPGRWFDASPFGRLYFVGTPSEAYHTGADLNLPGDGDAHDPLYAVASGVVTFAAALPVWGNVIIIKHDPLMPDSRHMYSRYGHVESMVVKVGDRVQRGQQIARVGNAFGRWAYHLHYDISPTTILESNPEHWPGRDRDELFRHYIDPRIFIEQNRPI